MNLFELIGVLKYAHLLHLICVMSYALIKCMIDILFNFTPFSNLYNYDLVIYLTGYHLNYFIIPQNLFVCILIVFFIYNAKTTFSDGCLGSHNDEERSEMRYVMRIAEFSESSKF